jgi:hypothetical protein
MIGDFKEPPRSEGSAAWCDRITNIHTFRNMREPNCIERDQEYSSYVIF